MVTFYSTISAIIIFNLALLLIFLLRRSTIFMVKFSPGVLVWLSWLSLLRIVLPVNQNSAHIIRSRYFLPALERLIHMAPDSRWPSVHLGVILLIIWAMGSAVLSAVLLKKIHREHRLLSSLRLVYDPQVYGLCKGLIHYEVRVSPDVRIPFAAGIFRHIIYMPKGQFSDDELRYMLLHEAAHIRSRDALIKLLYWLIAIIFWYNPITHLFLRELDAILELRCDSRVTRVMGEDRKLDYLSTLNNLACYANFGHRLNIGSAMSGRNYNELWRRNKLLLSTHKRRHWLMVVIMYILILALFIGSYSLILVPEHPSFPVKSTEATVTELVTPNLHPGYIFPSTENIPQKT